MATGNPKPLGVALTVRVDRVYGNIVTYPVCDRAKLLAEIAGTKTLTPSSLALAERLGFQIIAADSGAAMLATVQS